MVVMEQKQCVVRDADTPHRARRSFPALVGERYSMSNGGHECGMAHVPRDSRSQPRFFLSCDSAHTLPATVVELTSTHTQHSQPRSLSLSLSLPIYLSSLWPFQSQPDTLVN